MRFEVFRSVFVKTDSVTQYLFCHGMNKTECLTDPRSERRPQTKYEGSTKEVRSSEPGRKRGRVQLSPALWKP